jgi:hypothetical protein
LVSAIQGSSARLEETKLTNHLPDLGDTAVSHLVFKREWVVAELEGVKFCIGSKPSDEKTVEDIDRDTAERETQAWLIHIYVPSFVAQRTAPQLGRGPAGTPALW